MRRAHNFNVPFYTIMSGLDRKRYAYGCSLIASLQWAIIPGNRWVSIMIGMKSADQPLATHERSATLLVDLDGKEPPEQLGREHITL